MKYSWLLFDADGTLFDFERAAALTLAQTFAQFGHSYAPEYLPIYNKINLRVWRDFEAGEISWEELPSKRFATFFAAIGINADPLTFSAGYLQNLSTHTDLLDGAAEVVAELAQVARLMIITNGLKDVQRPRFAAAAISQHFEDFVISEEVRAGKPDPKIFAEAFRRMQHPPQSEVLIIGDSLTSDIKGGNNFGIDTCWYNPGRKPRDPEYKSRYEITHLRELLAIVTA